MKINCSICIIILWFYDLHQQACGWLLTHEVAIHAQKDEDQADKWRAREQ